MALVYKNRTTQRFTLRGSKHSGKTLEEVGAEDIDYLKWIFQKGTADLDNESFYALEDELKKRGVDVAGLI